MIPLWKEVEYYKEYQKKLREQLGDEKADEIIGEALYVTSMGTNDFLENYYAFPGGRQSQYTIDEYQDFLAGIARKFVTDLYGLGARKISLGGVPPMGCMPLERTTNFADGQRCIKSYNDIALSFNAKLKSLTVELNNQLPGLQLVNSNPYGILMQIIRKPSLYGKFIYLYIDE